MNDKYFKLLIIVAMFVVVKIADNPIIVAQSYYENKTFQAGEKLSYSVYYKLGVFQIKLANVILWIEDTVYKDKKVYLMQNRSVTLPKYEWIIKANDYYASYIEKSSMKVQAHVQKTLVDDYYTNYFYDFDHSSNKLYASIENSNTKFYTDTIDLKPKTHDLLSAVYYSRNIDYSKLEMNQKVFLPVILDTTIHTIYYKYLGKEIIELDENKNIDCIKIAPLLVETSVFKAGEKMTAWISDDANKIPLLMESNLWIGRIKVMLDKCEGIVYPTEY